MKKMQEIKQELIDLGFRTASKGIIYWADAFEIIKKTNKVYRMMELYAAISKKRNKSASSIERAMRYSIEPAKENIQAKYDYHKKIDNMTYINLVRFETK